MEVLSPADLDRLLDSAPKVFASFYAGHLEGTRVNDDNEMETDTIVGLLFVYDEIHHSPVHMLSIQAIDHLITTLTKLREGCTLNMEGCVEEVVIDVDEEKKRRMN